MLEELNGGAGSWFTDAKHILCQHYMKDASIFIAERGKTEHVIAISALARAMKGMNKVAVARCVWRLGQANAVIGVFNTKFVYIRQYCELLLSSENVIFLTSIHPSALSFVLGLFFIKFLLLQSNSMQLKLFGFLVLQRNLYHQMSTHQ